MDMNDPFRADNETRPVNTYLNDEDELMSDDSYLDDEDEYIRRKQSGIDYDSLYNNPDSEEDYDVEDLELESMYKRGSSQGGKKHISQIADLGFSGEDKHNSYDEESCECSEAAMDLGLDAFGMEFLD